MAPLAWSADVVTAQSEQLDSALQVASGKRIKVEISGLDDALRDNVKLHLSVYVQEKAGALVSERGLRRFLRNAKQEVTTALQAYGYYSPTIRQEVSEGDAWRVSFDITAGPITRFRNVAITLVGEGENEAQLLALATGGKFSKQLRTGEPLLHAPYSALKSALQKKAYDLGYLDVAFTQSVLRVHPALQAADVELTLNTGKRYYFGEIGLEQTILAPQYVARFIEAVPGDPFSSEALLNLQQALTESNYFSHVSLDLRRGDSVNQRIPVNVKTEPRKAARYGVSAGYGTDTGPRAGVSTQLRRVNPYGHRFSGALEVSSVSASVASRYSIPLGDVRSESLDFSLNAQREEINDTEAREYRLATTLTQNRWGGQRRISLALAHENWRFGDGPTSEATLLMPGLDLTVKNADDPFFALSGYSYTLQLRGAAEGVASDVDFVQAVLFGRAVHSVTDRSRLLLRAEYGATITDAFDNLPPSLRFFAGGSQSVRGYGYKDLSPRDGEDNRIGGKYFTALGLELDYLIRGNMGVAAFVDAGDSTRDPIDELKLGAGLGFRYRSPVGMFRLDVAHPFDDPNDNVRVHISFGADL
ncbi:MAG: autotransporter assembly complex family protein [Halioglobus sp.]